MVDQENVWKRFSSLKSEIEDRMPQGLSSYIAGTGNKEFLPNINPETGFWKKIHGRYRWIFHLRSGKDETFEVALPEGKQADYWPGGMSIQGARKAVVGCPIVVLVRQSNGKYEWPTGWKWVLCLTLAELAPTGSTSVNLQNLNLKDLTITIFNQGVPIRDWVLVGLANPDDEYDLPERTEPVRYADVGKKLLLTLQNLGS